MWRLHKIRLRISVGNSFIFLIFISFCISQATHFLSFMTSVVLPENITAWGRGPAHVTQVGVVALKGSELPIFN